MNFQRDLTRGRAFTARPASWKTGGRKLLQSYNTDVCEIDENGVFHRYWSGYSATTMRHINEFLKQNDVPGGGAAWWRAQPVEAFGWPEFFAGALA